jgi:hypothetical protein
MRASASFSIVKSELSFNLNAMTKSPERLSPATSEFVSHNMLGQGGPQSVPTDVP